MSVILYFSWTMSLTLSRGDGCSLPVTDSILLFKYSTVNKSPHVFDDTPGLKWPARRGAKRLGVYMCILKSCSLALHII